MSTSDPSLKTLLGTLSTSNSLRHRAVIVIDPFAEAVPLALDTEDLGVAYQPANFLSGLDEDTMRSVMLLAPVTLGSDRFDGKESDHQEDPKPRTNGTPKVTRRSAFSKDERAVFDQTLHSVYESTNQSKVQNLRPTTASNSTESSYKTDDVSTIMY